MDKHLLFIAGSDIDYFYEVEDFLGPGDACLTKPLGSKIGGCVLNAASVASMLSSDVKVIDYLKENDEGTNLLIDGLNKNKVDTSYIQYGKNVENGTCLIMKKQEEKCIYVLPPKRPYFIEDDNLKDLIFNSKYIYSLMNTLRISFKDLSLLKEAKERGVKIVFDGGSQYKDDYEKNTLLELANGLFMNKTAYQRLCLKEDNPLEKMFNNGLEFACITDGANGTDMYLKDETVHEDAIKVDVVDSTGAGDSFAGAFLHFLDKGKDYKECLHLASLCGAYACLKEGGMAGAISEEELYEFQKNKA